MVLDQRLCARHGLLHGRVMDQGGQLRRGVTAPDTHACVVASAPPRHAYVQRRVRREDGTPKIPRTQDTGVDRGIDGQSAHPHDVYFSRHPRHAAVV